MVETGNRRLGDGVNRCPQCGSSDVQFRSRTGMLACAFCRHEWSEARLADVVETGDVHSLRGVQIGSGARDIDTGASSLLTLRCAGCGAEVVINADESVAARCHWCRHTLTVNEQIPNGAVPDAVLPFSFTHAQAVEAVRHFADKRRTFADRSFVRNFTPENVMGVYLPYMVVDATASAAASGFGEVLTREYTRGTGDGKETYYDADVYEVDRYVDFSADDLTLEASADRATMNSSNTNNIINTILPFDTENAVQWNASYLRGLTSERRDLNPGQAVPVLEHQLMSIARAQLRPSVDSYNRGVRWERERLVVHGSRWLSMYLPVWLYSHYQHKDGQAMVHYIAVNGRTGETMGSVPVSTPRLLGASAVVGSVVEAAVIALMVVG